MENERRRAPSLAHKWLLLLVVQRQGRRRRREGDSGGRGGGGRRSDGAVGLLLLLLLLLLLCCSCRFSVPLFSFPLRRLFLLLSFLFFPRRASLFGPFGFLHCQFAHVAFVRVQHVLVARIVQTEEIGKHLADEFEG